jgi:hypothetical protein
VTTESPGFRRGGDRRTFDVSAITSTDTRPAAVPSVAIIGASSLVYPRPAGLPRDRRQAFDFHVAFQHRQAQEKETREREQPE